MALTTLAATTAAYTYLNAKYHFRKDIQGIYNLRKRERQYEKAAKAKDIALFDLFEDVVKQQSPQQECLWGRESRYTWKEAQTAALQYAQFFQSHGAKRGTLVAFYLTNSPEFMLAFLGTWALGTAPAFINYNLGGKGLLHCLKLSKSKVLLVDEDSEVLSRIEEVRREIEEELGMKIVVLNQELKNKISALPPTRPDDSLRKATQGKDPAMLLYTSGTTGFPKAVAFDVRRVWTGTGSRFLNMGLKVGPDADRFYNCMPLYHGTGANAGILCLTTGLTFLVGKKFRVSTFWDDIRDSEATAFVYVGETARYLLAPPPSAQDKNHKVHLMFGNGLRPDVWRPFKERFGIETVSEFFNSSEGVFALININKNQYLDTAVGHHGLVARALLHNVFIPVEADHDGNLFRDPKTGFCRRMPYSQGGEILVAVPSVEESGFAGYTGSPEATKKKFALDVFKKGDLYYRSGDALRRDDEGRWFFVDRLGDTFRWKSENVSTVEVAVSCGSFPGVAEANVYGVLLPKHDGRAGCAALQLSPERQSSFDFAGFYKHLHKELPRYAVPVFLRIVKEMTPMHNNKQNKGPMRNEGVDPTKVTSSSPSDELYWARPGSQTYERFQDDNWNAIVAGRASL
ncbi:MAG: hypothetical protein M1828_002612 [Chrysothrix sp. TS-e1954]|nr:MAG: hypothetical protein M1828_002612 [Chrysothrix sp. TS-e1954]